MNLYNPAIAWREKIVSWLPNKPNILRLLFVILLSLTMPGHATQSSPADRCAVRNCTCRVVPDSQRTTPLPETSFIKRSIFFEEGSYEINATSRARINTFIQQNSPSNVTVTGFTDGCGSHEYNRDLASNRCDAVRQEIEARYPTVNVNVEIVGEQTTEHIAEARRVDITSPEVSRLTKALERIEADVYLIDASGSMANQYVQEWNEIISSSVTRNKRVFVSMMTGCRNMQSLTSITPQNGTEIWYSYWWVLDQMHSGQTLLIISDFESNIPLTSREHRMIEQKVRSKGVRVYTIRL
mgnify:CR=1 FL=1